MGKSLINDKSKAKLRLALSPSREHNLQEDDSCVNRKGIKTNPPLDDAPYIQRVKQLCQKIRNPKTCIDDVFRSPRKMLR
jgi:hypothetical protein